MALPSNMYVGETATVSVTYTVGSDPTPQTQWNGINSMTVASPSNTTTNVTAGSNLGGQGVTVQLTNDVGGCQSSVVQQNVNVCAQVTSISISPSSGNINQNVLFQATVNGGVDGNNFGGNAVWSVGGQTVTSSGQNISYNSQNYNIGGSGTNGSGFYQGVLMPSNPDTVPIQVVVTDCKGATQTANLMFSFFNNTCVPCSNVSIV